MAFKPLNESALSWQYVSLPMTASSTITKYDVTQFTSWYLVRCTSWATQWKKYVAMESKTTGAWENPEILVLPAHSNIRFIADTNADPVQATDVWVEADLTDHDTLNESASSNDVFFIESIVWATTWKKVKWYFLD
jgi:hypothetical protein